MITNAILFRKPTIHISGGEITTGVIDEQIRHMITKASHIHFTYADEYVEQVNEYYSYVNSISNTTGFTSGDYTIMTRMVDGVSLQEVTIHGSFTIN